MRPRVSTLALGLILVPMLVLVLASCGGGDDDTADPTERTPTSSVPASTTTVAASTTNGPAEPVPLTASFRGVTETEIHIGIGIIDASAFGFDNGDQEAQWQTAIDRANEAGGVLGRQLVPHFASYLPVGSVEPEAACAAHVEDIGVFAFIGAQRENNELCYSELNDTIAINTFPVTDLGVGRSDGLLFSTEPLGLGLELEAVAVLAAAGGVDGERFMIRALPAQESYIDPVRDAIEAAGGEVVSTSVQTTDGGDIIAAATEADVAVQRALADGATAIFGVGDIGLSMSGAVERAGADLTVASSMVAASTFTTFGYDLTAIDYVGLNRPPMRESYEEGDPGAQACLAEYESRTGNAVNVGVAGPEVDNFEPLMRTCRGIEMFVAIATAAGPELTNDSFRAAAATLASFSLTAADGGALGPDRVGADATPVAVLRWNPEILAFSSEE